MIGEDGIFVGVLVILGFLGVFFWSFFWRILCFGEGGKVCWSCLEGVK